MKRGILVLVALLALAGGSLVSSGEDTGGAWGFGFGGGGMAAFFPDLEGVNAFLSENGLPAMPSFLVGGGGGGRGGVIGGLSLGGMGFGATGTSTGLDRSAELAVGGGGFDLGFAIGGDETSVLTLGAVLGGGASVLELSIGGVVPMDSMPQGVIPTPMTRTLGRAFAMVMPYVSFEAQLASFVGFDVRIGYVVPVVGFDFGEGVGIPAPSLNLSGPFVSVSIVFGGIGRAGGDADEEKKATLSGSLELVGPAQLLVENRVGDIVISSYAYSETQTGSRRIVEWSAVCEGSDASTVSASPVEALSGPGGASLRTIRDIQVDYVLRVPSGTDLELTDGAGAVHIVGHSASSMRVSVGAGEMSLADIDAGDLSLSLGVGEIAVQARALGSLSAHAGIGLMRIYLPPDASASVSASVGIGETVFEGFPATSLRERGFLWTRLTDAVLGAGAADWSLSVGIGQIEVRVAKPVGD
jgi:hypothetical protein